jgi:superfamily II DNA or RNA helicase
MTPRAYQIPGIQKAVAALPRYGAYLLADATGTGKTVTSLFIAKELSWPIAVVCPKAVIPSWKKVASQIGVEVLFIENIERIRARKEWLVKEAVKGKRKPQWVWKLPKACLLVFDEVHRFSAPDSQSAEILKAAPKPLLMLSATCADSPLKLRAIGHHLGLAHWDEWYSWCFKNGCKKAFFGGLEFRDARVLPRLHKQIFTEKGSRVRKEDLPNEFPEETVETVLVPVENAKALNQEYMDALELLEAEAPSAAVALLRARQKSEHLKVPAMIEMTEDLLEENNSVCLFIHFRESLDQLAKRFPDAALIYGGQNPEERQQHIDAFQDNEKRLVIAMIQAGGIGISLHDLHGWHPRVSLINPGYSAIELIQALGRIPRNGGRTPCVQKLLFAEGTVEESIQEKVQKKIDRINTLNDGDLAPANT